MNLSPFKAVYPDFDFITSADSFFGSVKVDFAEYRKSGFFQKSDKESIYLYQIADDHRTYTGIIACASIDDFLAGRIKKHENTLSSKEQRQMHLLLQRQAMVKPVLLIYPAVQAIDDLVDQYIKKEPPFFSAYFEEEAQKHTFWEIDNTLLIEKIKSLFLNHVPETYIADGHHRTSTTALLYQRRKNKEGGERYNKLLSAFFPSHELEIRDYNRVIEILEDISLTTFMAKLSQVCDIEILSIPRKPEHKYELTMFVNREWFRLTWKQEIIAAQTYQPVLDASLLDKYVLQDILGIEDVSADTRIKYISGVEGLESFRAKTIQNEHRLGFCLYPVELKDLIQVADAGEIMPPKSTFFEPRMKNGLIVYEI